MPLTYTEIEQEKNTKIFLFFAVVVLFYFIIALVMANLVKIFILSESGTKNSLLLTGKEVLAALLIALAIAVLHSAYSAVNAVSLIQKNLGVEPLDQKDRYHNTFGMVVDELNVATGNKYKITPVVMPTTALNAFAISDFKKNAVIGVTEGLLSKLTRQQLQAVAAHEVAHVVSGDSFQTTVACSLFGIYAAVLRNLEKIFRTRHVRVSGRGGGAIFAFLFLVYVVLSIMQLFYTFMRFTLSRNRELRADAIAVRLTRDPISLSEALYSIWLGWRGLGHIDAGLEPIFIMNPLKQTADEKEDFLSNLFSTHPPISKRIAILAQMAHTDLKNIEESVMAREELKKKIREAPVSFFDKKLEGLPLLSFNCPKCSQALVKEDYEGASVMRCVFCGGALAEKSKLQRIIIRREKGFDDRIKKLAVLAQKNGLERIGNRIKTDASTLLECPRCQSRMIRGFYTSAYLIETDQCAICNLVWFDKDELEMVQYLIEERKAAKL